MLDTLKLPAWKVFAAPWRNIFRPRVAAASFIRGSAAALALHLALNMVLITLLVLMLVLWASSVRHVIDGDGPIGDKSIRGFWGNSLAAWEEGHVAATWTEWAGLPFVSPAEMTLIVVPAVFAATILGLAVLQLPVVHGGDSLFASFQRALHAVASGTAVLFVAVLFCGMRIVYAIHADYAARAFSSYPGLNEIVMGLTMVLTLGSAALVLFWLGCAAAGNAQPPDIGEQPRCEGCGYDLSHLPDTGLCSECNYSVLLSLTPNAVRHATPWEDRPSWASWLSATAAVLIRPSSFYRAVRIKSIDPTLSRFRTRHYALIGIGAGVWVMSQNSFSGGSPGASLLFATIIGILSALAGWLVHHVAGALVLIGASVKGCLADCAGMVKVFNFETAFLLVFCAFNGTLLTSFTVFGSWVTQNIGSGFFFRTVGLPAEPVLLLTGNAIIGLFWLLRFILALRATRWSNF